MAESLVLFESVINSRWFLHTSIILLLNKIDVFKHKLPKACSVHCVISWSFSRHSAPPPCMLLSSVNFIHTLCPPEFERPFSIIPAASPLRRGSMLFLTTLLCPDAHFLVPLLIQTLLPLRSHWNGTSQNTRVVPMLTRRPSTSCGSSCRLIGGS